MNTTRTINHGDGHTDIETYLQDADGVWMWAVTKCNGGNMYDGYQESQAMTESRRARIDANIEQLRIRDEMIAEVAPMLGALQSAVAGTFIVDDGGVDTVDAERWQDENSCVACSARHGCKSFCQVRKQYELKNRWQLNAIAEEADYNDLRSTERSQLP